jgi:predicted ribonuclease YlaK
VHNFSKLFPKIIANRLKPRLAEIVSMNQSVFVRGRSLHDNFVLVRQVARRINQRRNTIQV